MNRVLYLTSAGSTYKCTVVFIVFPSESSKLREEMVLLKTQSTVQLQWKNIVLDKAVCYYSGARFLNEKLFCLEIDCGITSLMLEEMLISSFFVGLIH